MIYHLRTYYLKLRFLLLGRTKIRVNFYHAPEKGPFQLVGTYIGWHRGKNRRECFETCFLYLRDKKNALFLQGDHMEWSECVW